MSGPPWPWDWLATSVRPLAEPIEARRHSLELGWVRDLLSWEVALAVWQEGEEWAVCPCYLPVSHRHLCRPCHNHEKAKGLGKYICQRCHLVIEEQPLMFKSDAYHPDHFSCTHCRRVGLGLVQSGVGPPPGQWWYKRRGAGWRWMGQEGTVAGALFPQGSFQEDVRDPG